MLRDALTVRGSARTVAAMPITATAEREQLIRDGFCVFEQVLDADTVAGLNEMSEWTLAQVDPSHFADNRARGSIIPYWTYPHPAFTQLLGHAGALAVFASLGFDRPKVWSGFVISKPPHSPPLHWHQDGLLWGHPISYTDQPQQFFLMYYLVDTSRDNGCLRLVPGSHRKRHPLHDQDPRATREHDVIRDVDARSPRVPARRGRDRRAGARRRPGDRRRAPAALGARQPQRRAAHGAHHLVLARLRRPAEERCRHMSSTTLPDPPSGATGWSTRNRSPGRSSRSTAAMRNRRHRAPRPVPPCADLFPGPRAATQTRADGRAGSAPRRRSRRPASPSRKRAPQAGSGPPRPGPGLARSCGPLRGTLHSGAMNVQGDKVRLIGCGMV